MTFSHKDLSTTAIGDHDLASKLPVPTDRLSIQPNTYNLIELGIRENIPKSVDGMIGCDSPQLSAHVVSFQNATLVSISWPHSVMGSMGFSHFMHSWSLVLSSRESEVPKFLGANEDALLELEMREPLSIRQELLIQKSRLTGFNLVLFCLRLVWNMRTPREVKTIFIPKRALAQLQAACRDEIAETSSPQGIVLPTEEMTILAWFVRLVSLGSSSDKPVTIVSMLSVMQAASSLFSQAGIHAHNMTLYAMSFLPSHLARGGLGPLVQQYTRQVKEQSTQEQCLSFLRMYRQTTRGGNPFKPLYGPSNAHPVACADLGKVDPIHSADFGAALVEKPESSGDRPLGAMTCYYYHIINSQLGAGLDCIYLLGKDHGENLWVMVALPASRWPKVEAALRAYQ